MTEAIGPYTLRAIEQMLGLPRGVVAALVEAGFVTPTRGPRNEQRFSFRDVVLLRTAHELRAARIPQRRLMQSLRRLRERLPQELPLSGLRIRAVGNDVVVREGGAHWEARSGQLLLDLEVAPSPAGSVAFFRVPDEDAPAAAEGTAAGAPTTAQGWFERGQRLEGTDPEQARAAYRRALAIDPRHEHAYVDLGAMLCEAGRCDEALTLYEQALRHCPDSALVHFNRAIALEDNGRLADALEAYRRCLTLDPGCADAHFNAARLHEQLGQAQQALRHYSAYRRLRTPA